MDSKVKSNSFGIIAPNVCALIVDDNKMDRALLRDLLNEMQIKTESAYDGKEAVDKTNEKQYDIIFMDQQMPVLNGSEATEIIRKNPLYSLVPIIAVTSDDSDYTRCLLMYEGTNDCVFKPISAKKLINIIEKWIPKEKTETVEKTVENSEIDPFDSISAIDYAGAVQFLGSKKLYKEFVMQFLNSSERRINSVNTEYKNKNYQGYASAIRSLKVMTKQIGAQEISDKALRLEEASKNGDVDFVLKTHPVFVEEYADLVNTLSNALEG